MADYLYQHLKAFNEIPVLAQTEGGQVDKLALTNAYCLLNKILMSLKLKEGRVCLLCQYQQIL